MLLTRQGLSNVETQHLSSMLLTRRGLSNVETRHYSFIPWGAIALIPRVSPVILK